LTNVKGWKDEDEGHRAKDSQAAAIDASFVSPAHVDASARHAASDIALSTSFAGDTNAIGVDMQAGGDMCSEAVEDSSAALVQSAEETLVHIKQVDRQDIDVSESSLQPAASSSLAPSGTQALQMSNIATRTETRGDIPPSVHGVTSTTAAAAAAAASIASAAAEMFRGQLEAISTSGSVQRCCSVSSINFFCSGRCRNSWF
jgi:hypothetical protein